MAAARDMKDTLRYKHMVTRLRDLPAHKKEAALLQEIAAGKQWRIDAALEAVSPADWKLFDITNIFKNAAIHARLQTVEKIADTLGLSKGETPLQVAFDVAARNGNYKTAQALFERGASASVFGEATEKAVAEGDVRKLNFLLKTGAEAKTLHGKAVLGGNAKAAAHLETKLPAPEQPLPQPATVVKAPEQFKTDLDINVDIVFLNEWQVPAIAPELKDALKAASKSSQGIEFTLNNGHKFGWSEQTEGREFIGTRDQKQEFDGFDARAIVAASRSRGWTSIRVHGTDEQKEALWLEAQRQKIDVIGYEPPEGSDVRKRAPAPAQRPPSL
ncbi:MAG: LPD7 domain-containing protein [Alphaproteobacteria bacterium]